MNWFYNLKIRTRLLAGFILIALISGAIGYIGVQKIHEVNERGAFLYRNMTVPLSQISNIATDYQRVRVNIRDVIIAKEPSEIQANIDQINKLKTKIDKEVQAFAVLISNEDVQRAYNDLVKARQDYDSYLEQICILSKANHDEEAFALLNGDAKVAADAEREAIDKLVHLKVINAKETADMNTSVANASSKEMELFLALGVGLALFLGIFISRSIVKPTAILQKELDKLAEKGGDLTQDIDVNSKDELGDLGRAVNKFIANLRMIMMEVTNSSNSVAATAQQLKSSAEQTTDSVNETAATMNEISTTVEQVSDSLQHISYASEMASGHASEGNQGINKLIEQMENISNSSHEAAQVINYLSTKSHEIGQIVELINAIAGQTNMLALNAAIEAARAGEQGRGFAVVAEEVKKLAEQSANAAKQIKELINAIQLESQNAVDKVAAGGKDVETGILVVHEVGESFKQIISAVQGLTAQMQEVTSATEEMASGVQNIAASTEEQTAAMEEVSASAESLSTLADGLNNIVSKFKL